MSYYDFQKEDAFRFRDFIRAKARVKGNELIFQECPYCKSRSNDKEKFSINLETGKFNCFRASCGMRGNMITLSRDFNFSLSDDVDRYYNLNSRNDRFRKFKEFKAVHSDKAVNYCRNRGISPEVCEKYELTTKKDDDKILVFPFKNERGELKFIKYRNMEYQKGDHGSKEWCEKDCMPILFGMNHIPEDAEEIILTEGQLDTLAVVTAGYDNVVSVPTGANGFTWIPHCWNFLKKFKSIVIFGDCENGKITLSEAMLARFGKIVRIARIEDYQGYKDANDILLNLGADAIKAVIENAEYIKNERIVCMSDVHYVDLKKIPKIKTGIRELDTILGGGLIYGSLVIQTGKRGDGKSTWVSNICVEAIHEGINCMIYSGEMPKIMVKNWIDSQIVGKQVLTNSEIDKCDQWYRNRLYIYDSDIVNEEDARNEEDILLETFEEAIVKLSVSFLVIDNLMTIVDSETNENLYRRQSIFTGRLAKMCKKYGVVIILVAHPRKSRADELENDDVSGASEITNKADVVMNYGRLTQKEAELERKEGNDPDSIRWISVKKNRTGNGKLGKVKVDFSPDSKRIVSHGEGFVKNYLTDDEFIDPIKGEQEEIPFL